jgi:pSer/pThr/pTyr-binding forkhead associated (FHA) protein
VRLRYRDQDLFLAAGQYVLGRSSACHIVIDHGLVSRRHAMLEVTASGASVRDLGSINGVLVNGERIGDKPRVLADGDRITVGQEPLDIKLEELSPDDPRGRATRDTRPTVDVDPRATARPQRPATADGEIGVTSVASTQRVEPLELVSMVANKALAAGRVREAENMLRLHLNAVLQDLRNKRPQPPEAHATASSLGLKLARATSDGRWFDYVIDLLLCQPGLPDGGLLTDLEGALARLPIVDVSRLERYAQTVRALPASYEKLRALQRVEALVQLGHSKRR